MLDPVAVGSAGEVAVGAGGEVAVVLGREVAVGLGRDVAVGAAILRAALSEIPLHPDDLDSIEEASTAHFPIKAADLMPRFEGRALGEKLAALEQRWIASGFKLTRDALLDEV